MHRTEINLETGEQVEIEQRPYLVGGQIVVLDATEPAPEGATVATASDIEAAQPKPVRVVSMRQARLALLSMGLLDDVATALGMLPEPQQTAAKIEWEYATEVRSDNDTVELLAETIGLDLEQLFDIAEGIQ